MSEHARRGASGSKDGHSRGRTPFRYQRRSVERVGVVGRSDSALSFGGGEVRGCARRTATGIRCRRGRTRNDPATPRGGCRGWQAGPQRCVPPTSRPLTVSASLRSGRRSFTRPSRRPTAGKTQATPPSRGLGPRPQATRPRTGSTTFGLRRGQHVSATPTPREVTGNARLASESAVIDRTEKTWLT